MNSSKIPETDKIISLLSEGKTRSEIAKIFKVHEATITNWLKKFKINVKDYTEFRLSYNVHVFDTIDSEEKAYWLGFLYADGCVLYNNTTSTRNYYHVRIALKSTDIEHLRKFKDFLQDNRDDSIIHIRTENKNGKIYESCRYSVSNKHLAESLVNLGCTPRKSLTLTFPDIKKFNNPDLIFDFIRGYCDGDGCLSYYTKRGKTYPSINIVGTYDFLSGITKYIPQFKKVYKKRGENVFQLDTRNKLAREVANKLYGHATIYLDRKYERFKALFKYNDSEINNGE